MNTTRFGGLLFLATLSGIPALVYEVVWTREVALLAGSQIEAISVVLVSYFGGLALGTRLLGPRADRAERPLRLYGALEVGAGAAAIGGSFVLRWARAEGFGVGSELGLLALGAALLLPVTFLLGGTLPALVRTGTADPLDSARVAGWILAANTAGAVAGVAAAVLSVPRFGLRATLLGAGVASIVIGIVAASVAGRARPPAEASPQPPAPGRVPARLLAAAALAGGATLGYEVLAARAAALRLGSSTLR